MPSCFCGRCRTRWPSPGCTGTTTPGPDFNSCRSSTPTGKSTGRQATSHCLALLAVGLLPTLVGLAGPVYFCVAFGLGSMFLWYSVRLALARSPESARRLLFASLIYLPLLLAVMAFDKVPL